MGRWIGPRCALLAVLLGIFWIASVAQASDPRAAERFRAAAALENRALYDLAASEYASLVHEFAADPLADRARLQRGICLFQLARYEEARTELRALITRPLQLEPKFAEQCCAYLGLAQYNLGCAAEGAGRSNSLDAAIAALDQQLTQFPNGPLAAQAVFYRAEALYARGRLDAAVAAYRALLKQYPQHLQRADVLFALGVAELELGAFDNADPTLEQFRNEFPEHPSAADGTLRLGEALVGLAELQLGERKSADALRTIDRFFAEFPDSELMPRALVIRARAHLGQSQPDAAEVSLDEFLKHYAEHELANVARLLRATVRHGRGDFASSIADVDAILANDPPHRERSDALHLRGLCELGLAKPADAALTFSQIVETDPQCPSLDRVLYDLAWAYQDSGKSERAVATFAKLTESFPKSPLAAECHYRVGEAHYAAKEFASAAKCFWLAGQHATDPELLERSLHKLAWSCFEQQQFGAAEEAFDRQIATHHERIEEANGSVDATSKMESLAADALAMVAECRFQLRDYQPALSSFDVALLQPSLSESLRAMALIHAAQAATQLHEWQRSLELSDQLLGDFPNNEWAAEARCERGTALFELGRLDESQREFTPLVAHAGVLGVRAEFMLGKIHVARKQYDGAVRAFFKVAYGHGERNAPESYQHWQAEAIYEAARCLENTKRPDSARKLYQELVDRYPASDRAAAVRQSLESIKRR